MRQLKVAIGISFIVLLCLFLPLNPLIYANSQLPSVDVPPSTDWVYINRTMTNLSITTAGYATATAQLVGIPGVTTEVWIFMYLERYSGGSWTSVDSWYQSYPTYSGILQKSTYVASGYLYRVKASYYAYSGDDYEHVVQYSSSVYY